MSRRMVFVALVAAGLMLVAALPSLAAPKKVLRVGSDCTYPPFEFQDDKGKIVGFSIDLIDAVADRMNMDASIINTSWDGIIPGLINGNYDVLISSMTITAERAQAVNFSDPYFTANQCIVVRKASTDIKKASDIKGKHVSVQISTTGDIEVTDHLNAGSVDRFPTTPDALLSLRNGSDDASVVDEPLARYFIKKYPDLRIANNDFAKEDYGIAVAKGNPALLKDINKALKELKANGKYAEIFDKWF